MAKISFLWDGKTSTPPSTTTNYFQGATYGYFHPSNYLEEWTGVNLSYFGSDSALPTSGQLNSYSYISNNGLFSFSITDLNYVIPKNPTFDIIISGILSGQDDWYGDSKNNFFILSVGGDTYHGGDGIDTLDAIVNKSTWVTASTKFTKQSNGNIQINNFGLMNLTLDSVERIKYKDVSTAFDINGNAGKAAKILGAIFGPNSITNKEYVGIGVNLLDSGMSYKDLLDLALNVKLGVNYSTESEIRLLYSNIFNISPSATTLQMFKGLIENNFCTKSEIAYVAAESLENSANINLIGLSSSGIDYIPAA